MATHIRSFEFIDENVDLTVKGSGWRLVNTPAFDPLNVGYGIAHDAIEHFQAGEEGIENEMMAFGSIYHIRILGGWWYQFGFNVNPPKMVAWDIARFLHEIDFNIKACDTKPSKTMNNFFVEGLQHYIEHLATKYNVPRQSDQMVKAIYAYQTACGWMTKGYTRSKKRWSGHTSEALTNMFNSVSNAIDRVKGVHGDMLKVIFDTKSLDHKCEHLALAM